MAHRASVRHVPLFICNNGPNPAREELYKARKAGERGVPFLREQPYVVCSSPVHKIGAAYLVQSQFRLNYLKTSFETLNTAAIALHNENSGNHYFVDR